MRSATAFALIAALLSGCATGYGALAGAGACATLGFVASAASGQGNVALVTAEGFLLGALAGAIGGAVAGAVVRGKERRVTDELRTQLQRQRRVDEETIEERLQRLEAARFSVSNATPSDSRRSAVQEPTSGDLLHDTQPTRELSPHVREFSADP